MHDREGATCMPRTEPVGDPGVALEAVAPGVAVLTGRDRQLLLPGGDGGVVRAGRVPAAAGAAAHFVVAALRLLRGGDSSYISRQRPAHDHRLIRAYAWIRTSYIAARRPRAAPPPKKTQPLQLVLQLKKWSDRGGNAGRCSVWVAGGGGVTFVVPLSRLSQTQCMSHGSCIIILHAVSARVRNCACSSTIFLKKNLSIYSCL